MEAKATARYLRISPRKARLLADLIRGRSVEDAEIRLQFSEKQARLPIRKLLRSAVANAKGKKLEDKRLYVKKITVDGGAILHRFAPRAFGRAAPIRKRTSHITIILSER